MINDVMDSLGVTRNSVRFWGFTNIRTTALVAIAMCAMAGPGARPVGAQQLEPPKLVVSIVVQYMALIGYEESQMILH